jgi:hypothetical protein
MSLQEKTGAVNNSQLSLDMDESQTTTPLMGSPCQTASLSATATLDYKTAATHTPLNKCQADEDTLTKAMKRAASRNTDGPKKDKPMGEISPLSAMSSANMIPGMPKLQPSSISIVSIPQKRCISKLSNVGLVLGSNSNTINLSINALKRVEVDRTTVTPNQKETKRLGVGENPFVASDNEDTKNEVPFSNT